MATQAARANSLAEVNEETQPQHQQALVAVPVAQPQQQQQPQPGGRAAAPPDNNDDIDDDLHKATKSAFYVDLPLPKKFVGDEDIFPKWKAEMKNVLIGRSLWPLNQAAPPAEATPIKKLRHQRRTGIAKCLLFSAIDHEHQLYVGEDSTAAAIWQKLCERYESNNIPATITCINDFYKAKMEPAETLHAWFSRLRDLGHKLPTGMVTEPAIIWRTLEGLPEEYLPIIASLRNLTTVAEVQNSLLLHEAYLKNQKSTPTTAVPLATAAAT